MLITDFRFYIVTLFTNLLSHLSNLLYQNIRPVNRAFEVKIKSFVLTDSYLDKNITYIFENLIF
jgi:hypothetical protein